MSSKISMNEMKISASRDLTMDFSASKTYGEMIAAIRYGATQIFDDRGRAVPRYGDTLASSSPGLIATTIDLEPLSSTQWKVSVQYTTKVPTFKTSSTDPTKPWNARPEINWTTIDKTEVLDRYYISGDTKGNPSGLIRLPNGRPFSEPPVLPVGAANCSLKWATQYSIQTAGDACEFTTNNATIKLGAKTIAAYTGYIGAITENEAYLEDGTLYYTHDANVIYMPRGHHWKPVAMDYMAVIGGELQKVQCKAGVYGWFGRDDTAASYITEPVFLASDGTLLSTDPMATVTPYVMDFQTIWTADWSALELD